MNPQNNEKDLNEINQTWRKLEHNAKTVGFKEGVEAGKESQLQSFFDRGYIQGYKCGLEIGIYNAIISRIRNPVENLPQDVELASSPNQGFCIICKHKEYLSTTTVNDIINKQIEESNDNFNRLYSKFHSKSDKCKLVKL